MSDMNWV